MFLLDKPAAAESYLFCKVTIAGKVVKRSLGFKVTKENWSKKTTGSAANDRILEKIEQFVSNAKIDAKYTGRHLTAEMLSAYIDEVLGKTKRETNKGFSFVSKEIIKDMESGLILTPQGKLYDEDTISQYRVTKRLLIDFGIADFNIDINHYYDFISFCSKKNLAINSIGGHVKRWKRLMNIAEEKGYHSNQVHRSPKFKILTEDSKRVALNEDEIEAIAFLEIDPELKTIINARDWFSIDCYTGLRVSDLVELNEINIVGDFFLISNEKTDQAVNIPIHPVVKEIISRRGGLPEKISPQKINEHIKTIAQAAGVDKIELKLITKGGKRVEQYVPKYKLITNHTARRSLITNARKNTLGDNIIMKITGIRDIKTLQKYDKITPEEAAKIAANHSFFKPVALKKQD